MKKRQAKEVSNESMAAIVRGAVAMMAEVDVDQLIGRANSPHLERYRGLICWLLSGHNGFHLEPSDVIAACLHRSEAEVERLTLQFDAALPDDIEMLDLVGRLAIVDDIAPAVTGDPRAPRYHGRLLAEDLGLDARDDERVSDAVLAAVAIRGHIAMGEVKLIRADLAGYHSARQKLASIWNWSESNLYVVLGDELEIDIDNAEHAGNQDLAAKLRKALFADDEVESEAVQAVAA